MGTLVCFHAHPDDEAITTGGTHRRVPPPRATGWCSSCATNGEHGEVPDDLADGETLVDRRRHGDAALGGGRSASHRVEWLGYQRLGHDRLGAERRPGVVLAGRRRRGRPSGWPRSCARSTPTC